MGNAKSKDKQEPTPPHGRMQRPLPPALQPRAPPPPPPEPRDVLQGIADKLDGVEKHLEEYENDDPVPVKKVRELEEVLMQLLLRCDGVEGDGDIRVLRRGLVKRVQQLQQMLDQLEKTKEDG